MSTYKLYHGDCLEVMGKLDAGSNLYLVTDPPYGLGDKLTKGGKGGSFKRLIEAKSDKWDIKPSKETFDLLLSITDHQIIWGGNFFDLPPTKKPLCWDKVRPNQKNLSEWEMAWTSFEGRAQMFKHCANGGFIVKEPNVHPTQKPLPLMIWCMSFLPEGITILDPYMGSGTTGVAAMKTGRNFIGIEQDAEYFAIAETRIKNAAGDFTMTSSEKETGQMSIW